MTEVIGITITAVATVAIIILFIAATIKQARRDEEWENRFWEDKK